jgi:pimeloyl-ACP methyl ester carboxylesterase
MLSIIAVHGLNPRGKDDEAHAFGTWTKDGRLWLRDDLKDLAPKARVFLYVYNSKLVFGGDKHNFVLMAKQLLDAIFTERKQCPTRPIILIGHSLGGLLIEQAIINAYQSHRYRPIKDAISTVMFFGTPHEGGNNSLVTIGSIAAKIARFVGAQQNPDIEQILAGGSLFTEIRQFNFQNRLLEFMIVSFWEGEGNVSGKSPCY